MCLTFVHAFDLRLKVISFNFPPNYILAFINPCTYMVIFDVADFLALKKWGRKFVKIDHEKKSSAAKIKA